MATFRHAVPEQQLAEGLYGVERRITLHQEALRLKLISPEAPTPDKATLIRMLENKQSAEQALASNPEVPQDLNTAHLTDEQKAQLLAQLQAEQAAAQPAPIVQETPVPADSPVVDDPFGDAPADNPEEVFQRIAAEPNVMKAAKLFRDEFPAGPELPKKVTKAEILDLTKRMLNLGDA